MKTFKRKSGLTLVEMLVVVAVIAILTSIVISVATRIEAQADEKLMLNTFGQFNAALDEFKDFNFQYKDVLYEDFDFPLDCNDFAQPGLESTIANALGATVAISGGTHLIEYSGSEAMYFFLSRVPACRKILDKIDSAMVTNLDAGKNEMLLTVDGAVYPLFRIIDPWGKTLRYEYYKDETRPEDRRTYPLITSAGPDGVFDTDDDLTNR